MSFQRGFFCNALLNSGESVSVAECALESVQCFMEGMGATVHDPMEFSLDSVLSHLQECSASDQQHYINTVLIYNTFLEILIKISLSDVTISHVMFNFI